MVSSPPQPPYASDAIRAEARNHARAIAQFHPVGMIAATDAIDRVIITATVNLLMVERLALCVKEKNTVSLHPAF
jgi:hypothetical protein